MKVPVTSHNKISLRMKSKAALIFLWALGISAGVVSLVLIFNSGSHELTHDVEPKSYENSLDRLDDQEDQDESLESSIVDSTSVFTPAPISDDITPSESPSPPSPSSPSPVKANPVEPPPSPAKADPVQPPPVASPDGPCAFPSNYRELNMRYIDGPTRGWAMPGPCEPGRNCVYQCRRGYVRTSAGYDSSECPPVDGTCSAVYHYQTSKHGLHCDASGRLDLPSDDLCQRVDSYITLKSRLGVSVTGCPTIYPGTEDIRSVPYTVPAGREIELTLFPANYWFGVSRHYYVGIAGLSPQDTCQWDALPKTAYIWGGNQKIVNGELWQGANFDYSENFQATSGSPGYAMEVYQCPQGRSCWKYCEIKRRVVGSRIENYSAVFTSDGNRIKEPTGPSSECFIYGPVTTRVRVDLVPYS